MRRIFISEDSATLKGRPLNFHAKWTLDGWNDHIIQPARDAVLDYYKVCMLNISSLQCLRSNSFKQTIYDQRYAEPSDVEEYVRINNLS